MHAHESTGFNEAQKMVTKRDGSLEPFSKDELTKHLSMMCDGLNKDHINIDVVVGKVMMGLPKGVKTVQIVDLCAETCAYMAIVHPDYTMLANRITVSSLHRTTSDDIGVVAETLYRFVDSCGRPAPLLCEKTYNVIIKYRDAINKKIDYKRDFNYDFFGFKTLERAYLLRVEDKKIAERPQHLLMRVSFGIHLDDIESAFETYDLMSELWFTHATPTLFNSGCPNPQMSSCFLLNMREDSIHGIYDTLK